MRLFFCLMLLTTQSLAQSFPEDYPVAYQDTTIVDDYFGIKVADPYRWLENDTLTETKKWIGDEQHLSEKYLYKISSHYLLDRQLKKNGSYSFGTIGRDGIYYIDRISIGDQPSLLFIRKRINAPKDLAVDPRDYNNGSKDVVRIGSYAVSKDNKYLAFEISHSGSDWKEIRVETIYPFHTLKDVIKDVKFSNIVWHDDGFFYQRYPEVKNLLKDKNINPSIYYHRLGTEQSQDIFIYKEQYLTPDFSFYTVGKGKYLIIESFYNKNGIDEQKILAMHLDDSLRKTDTLLLSNQRSGFSVIDVYNDKFLVETTLQAPHKRLILLSKNERNKATEFIPEYKEVLVHASVVGNKVVCTYLNDLDYSIVTFDSMGKVLHNIGFPIGSSVEGLESSISDSITYFYHYSFLNPPIVYSYNVNSFEYNLIDQTKVNFDFKDYVMEKVHYKSKDGTVVTMILGHKKNLKKNGKSPTLLYGYGGYGSILTPFYDRGFISFMENDGIVAMPCIRGGGENGAEWHRNGARLNKQNVFDDFIGAAEFLVNEGYTSKERLAIMGGSNGGLLVAAVLNQRPDICKVAIADKGVYDMLRYQNYTIGNASTGEFGSSEDSTHADNLLKYSPIHNLKDTVYPSVLIITADHDDRAVPLHSYKYAAALQAKTKSANPVLLYTEPHSGHLTKNILTDLYIYSFIYHEMGIKSDKLNYE